MLGLHNQSFVSVIFGLFSFCLYIHVLVLWGDPFNGVKVISSYVNTTGVLDVEQLSVACWQSYRAYRAVLWLRATVQLLMYFSKHQFCLQM